MKIAVMAGTPVDTQMGVKLIENKGLFTLSCPTALTPEEQDKMQFLSSKELFEIVFQKANRAKEKGARILFLYCNSLSSAIDIEELQKKIGIPVITPFHAYQKIATQYTNLIIFAANSIASYKVEMTLKKSNPNISILSLGYLGFVHHIETLTNKENIITESHLSELFSFFNSFSSTKSKEEKRAILLACTHFPYLKREMEELSDYPILDPADTMLELIEELSKK